MDEIDKVIDSLKNAITQKLPDSLNKKSVEFLVAELKCANEEFQEVFSKEYLLPNAGESQATAAPGPRF